MVQDIKLNGSSGVEWRTPERIFLCGVFFFCCWLEIVNCLLFSFCCARVLILSLFICSARWVLELALITCYSFNHCFSVIIPFAFLPRIMFRESFYIYCFLFLLSCFLIVYFPGPHGYSLHSFSSLPSIRYLLYMSASFSGWHLSSPLLYRVFRDELT